MLTPISSNLTQKATKILRAIEEKVERACHFMACNRDATSSLEENLGVRADNKRIKALCTSALILTLISFSAP